MAFGHGKATFRMLAFSSVAIAAGWLFTRAEDSQRVLAGWLSLGMGAVFFVARLLWLARPHVPELVLSPGGATIRLNGWRDRTITVPWREVLWVDVRNIMGSARGFRHVAWREVATLAVSQAFFDTLSASLSRSDLVGNVFIREEGQEPHIVLHHFWLPISRNQLHDAILVRWRTFGPKAALPAPRGA